MDHQAFAQLLGNCVEFLGAVAVIATLGYLAIRFGKLLLLQDPCSVRAQAYFNLVANLVG